MNIADLRKKVDSFRWYHEIEIWPGVVTKPESAFRVPWKLIEDGMSNLDLMGKRVLDIGTRDGKFAFAAEKAGASVLAIDNDLSPAGLWLREHLKSYVEFKSLNLYDLNPETHGMFDVIFMFGVLYHLRYPMWGLRKVIKCLKTDGILCIESGMLDRFHEMPLMFCPTMDSPYEQTSCTFFNALGLRETLWSFGCLLNVVSDHPQEDGKQVRRMWIKATKTREMTEELEGYWEGKHHSHT